jgi:hypothetical protein
MTELEQALNQELTRLRTAVSYIEEANQLTANALAAAAEMKSENELLLAELRAVQQQLNTSNIAVGSPSATNQMVLLAATVGSALLLSCYALLRRRRK